jgi:outer membrane protein assembly factor BamB
VRGCSLYAFCVVVLATGAPRLSADDWPEIQGRGRQNVWTEDGILDRFPPGGLLVRWRTPVRAGYTGPAVADGRVFVADYEKTDKAQVERVLCLDEQSGKALWSFENGEVKYGSVAYGYGPRATPTVDGDRVFVLGAVGDLYCLDSTGGKLLWKVNYHSDLNARLPTWGFTASPLVYGDRLVCLVGAGTNATVVALDKATGKESWHAVSAKGGPGYSAPILINAGGVDQLIQWHGGAVSSLNPSTGEVYWESAYEGRDMLISTPVRRGDMLFVAAFFDGPMMLGLADDKPGAKLLWRGRSHSETKTDGLHCTISTPVIKDGYVYGVCSYGQFRCLEARTGERIWETQEVTRENARWASAFITRQGERFFINNDRGELIIAELSPKGYHEIDRTQLITPTSPPGNKREKGAVNWVLPAYANRHIVIRNDCEIIRASLERTPAASATP